MTHRPEESLGRMIYVLNLIAGKYARKILGPYGINKEQMFYLGTLITQGDGITQGELAGRLYVDKSATARTLVVLEKKGLILRKPVPGNVRANRVLVTEEARELWDSVLSKLWRWQDILLDGFTPQETVEMTNMLKRMETNAANGWKGGFFE